MPAIEFLRCPDGGRIAFTRHGSGPPLVCPSWWVSHVECDWQDEHFRVLFEALGAYRTVIRWDRRGSGLSDRDRIDFDLESEVAVLSAMTEHLALERFALFGISCGSPPSIAYAARNPERVSQLVLFAPYLRGSDAAPEDMRRAMTQLVRSHWGLGAKAITDLFAPDIPPEYARRLAHAQRATATPEMAANLLELAYGMDVRHLAPHVQAPALVLHRRGDQTIRVESGRDVAATLPRATFNILEGNEHTPWLGDVEPVMDAIGKFLVGDAPRRAATPGPGTPRPSTPGPGTPRPNTFCRNGMVWHVVFDGEAAHVAHSKGMSDLAVLLARPGSDVLCLELQQGPGEALENPVAQSVLDDRALRQYRTRVQELEQLIGEAEQNGDLGRLERLRHEWEAVTRELAQATGLAGRRRRLADPAERARKAVTARIRQAVSQIREVHPGLASHLEATVATGTRCSYRPPEPLSWTL